MATLYIAVENHPDRSIGGAWLDETEAEAFIKANYNAEYQHQMYFLTTQELSDSEILAAAERIKKEDES